jgi:hypothetical protein
MCALVCTSNATADPILAGQSRDDIQGSNIFIGVFEGVLADGKVASTSRYYQSKATALMNNCTTIEHLKESC